MPSPNPSPFKVPIRVNPAPQTHLITPLNIQTKIITTLNTDTPHPSETKPTSARSLTSPISPTPLKTPISSTSPTSSPTKPRKKRRAYTMTERKTTETANHLTHDVVKQPALKRHSTSHTSAPNPSSATFEVLTTEDMFREWYGPNESETAGSPDLSVEEMALCEMMMRRAQIEDEDNEYEDEDIYGF